MVWTALGLLLLALALGALTIHLGGNARAPDEQMRAILCALGTLVALVAAVVLGVLAWVG